MILQACFYNVRAWTTFVQHCPRHYYTRRSLKSSPAQIFFSTATGSHDDKATAKCNPKLWKGASHSSSEFVTHVIAGPEEPTVFQAIHSAVFKESDEPAVPEENNVSIPRNSSVQLSASQLLRMGSIWFLPSDAPRNPSMGAKPKRLSTADSTKILNEGDYLRIHHSPRRFPAVYDYSWNTTFADGCSDKPGVIVAQDVDKGYLVINKPAGVPVHPTVDNVLENVAESIRASMSNTPYVSTPQRLDQNTSGLLVVSTKKAFAAYYAKLLRKKTDQQLKSNNDTTAFEGSNAIHKQYKCLVCLMPPINGNNDEESVGQNNWSVHGAMDRLRSCEYNSTVVRHFLEPSIRAPKNFERVPGNESWAECLLRIVHVGDAFPLVGSKAAQTLANGLWNNVAEAMPSSCVAVVELEVELLTGRTHQIRGQLSKEGFPLVGDAQYGGACVVDEGRPGYPPVSASTHYVNSSHLALQCCQLDFLDPEVIEVEEDDTEVMVRSDQWNNFRLDEAWWTPLLQQYQQHASGGEATTSAADERQIKSLKGKIGPHEQEKSRNVNVERSNALPPRVSLAPGVHKYVIVKAKNRKSYETHEFVKSASPAECGGVYHANVAQDLLRALEASGNYDEVVVTGGGRIDYDAETPHAHVYGFSYGFGKGDHELAARVIEHETNHTIIATFDNDDGLY